MMEIVLASKSPRRHALLEMLGLRDFRVVPASCGEELPDLPPDGAVMQIAMAKALDVAGRVPDHALVIGADTLVYLDGIVLGKPADENEGGGMLRRLSGRRHAVYTGVALICGTRRVEAYEKTDVVFRALSEDEINAYVKTGEPWTKPAHTAPRGWALC
jgi:septum formation protein